MELGDKVILKCAFMRQLVRLQYIGDYPNLENDRLALEDFARLSLDLIEGNRVTATLKSYGARIEGGHDRFLGLEVVAHGKKLNYPIFCKRENVLWVKPKKGKK